MGSNILVYTLLISALVALIVLITIMHGSAHTVMGSNVSCPILTYHVHSQDKAHHVVIQVCLSKNHTINAASWYISTTRGDTMVNHVSVWIIHIIALVAFIVLIMITWWPALIVMGSNISRHILTYQSKTCTPNTIPWVNHPRMQPELSVPY